MNELKTLNEKIAERIGSELISLIPEEQWQDMVNREIYIFKRETGPKIIRDLLTEAFTEYAKLQLGEILHKDEYSELLHDWQSTKLKEFISASGGEIFASMLSPAMAMVLQDLHNRLTGY